MNAVILEKPFYRSGELERIQARADAPFGVLFLGVLSLHLPVDMGKVTSTQTNEETTLDGKSKLDPLYDEDEKEDEEIPEKY